MERYDVLVIGGGHAGCEAALCCARMGLDTLMVTLNLDAVALMPCNPAIGGTAKGHLVREIDALGGEMGLAIDDTFLQSRMLNTGKGPAVYSLRAQADKLRYRLRMRRALDNQERLTLRQGEIKRLLTENGRISGAETVTGETITCRAVVACCGVYLNSSILIGDVTWQSGPQGLTRSDAFSRTLIDLGFPVRRFKTGTPARLDGRSIDFSRMEIQLGDEPVTPFSFLTERPLKNTAACYLTYTTPHTHQIIRDNLELAPSYSGRVHGVGARYCPSIEDKVVRFADKERHPVFLEPEGADTIEWYAQGMSTGMPERVQREIYRSIPGLENAKLMRLAYAIEYDCIDPTSLDSHFQARHLPGFFGAGQLNGTSGYEEAAAQGLFAGINAALYVKGEPPFSLTRSQAYIGVLVDDLVTKGTDEPYRMMTSRAEYRLMLRQDNADLRLTRMGYELGLASRARLDKMEKKAKNTQKVIDYLLKTAANPSICDQFQAKKGTKLAEILRRPDVKLSDLLDEAAGLLPADHRETPNPEPDSGNRTVFPADASGSHEPVSDPGERPVSPADASESSVSESGSGERPVFPADASGNAVPESGSGERPVFPADAREQAEISIKYEGYLERQERQIAQFERMEGRKMPEDMDYMAMSALRIEARQKLTKQRPASLGQALRIPGVSPGDAAVLMVELEKRSRG